MQLKDKGDLSPKLLLVTKWSLFILAISAFGLFIYFFQPSWFKSSDKQEEKMATSTIETATTTPDTCPGCVRRLLDGVMVQPENDKLRPFAIMIDNFSSARPQFGLSAASLVFEAPAEGGITRYLAVFAPDMAPAEIGPVRSARSYFLSWAKELGATYVHVGGSPEALEMAKNLGSSDCNEFYNGSYFWRTSSRTAPHNVLISGDNLNKYRNDKGETGTELTPWQFKDAATSTSAIASKIAIKYSPGYDVYWQYQPDTNSYYRYLNNEAHTDNSGTNINARNIIVHLTSFKVTDEKLRLEMSTALSGTALLCQDGNCQMGTWKKNSTSSRAKYYYKSGEEFIFNAGTTWIEMTDDLQKIKY